MTDKNTQLDFMGLDANAPVLAFLKGKHCHSDIAEPLDAIMRTIGGVVSYCPDPLKFSYVLWRQSDVVIGFCEGMNAATLRLPNEPVTEILADGGKPVESLGAEWFAFPYNEPKLETWAIRAAKAAYGNPNPRL